MRSSRGFESNGPMDSRYTPDCWRYGATPASSRIHTLGVISATTWLMPERTERLRELLLDFDWLLAKLAATDVNALLADCEYLQDDLEVIQIQAAVRLSAHILAQDKTQLAGQLLGRIPLESGKPANVLIERAARGRGADWLRPLNPTLTPAGGPLVRTIIVGNTGAGWVGLKSTSAVTVCIAENGAVQEWDLESGEQASFRILSQKAIGAFLLLPHGRALSATDRIVTL